MLKDERAFALICSMAHMTCAPASTPQALSTQYLIRVEIVQALQMWLNTHVCSTPPPPLFHFLI